MDNIPEALKWAVGTLIAMAAALGVSKVWDIIRDTRTRQHTLTDRADAIHESNEAHKINAEVSLVQELVRRVESLETHERETQEKLMALTTTNAELKVENRYLKEQLAEAKEQSCQRQLLIDQLRKEVGDLQGQVAELIAISRGEK